MRNAERIGLAYDALAAGYDRQLARDRWMRDALWRRFDRLFPAGARVIDAGCGTGIDTLHLASRGVRVTAVDASAEMLAALRAKLAAASLGGSVDVVVGDIDDLAGRLAGPFDGLVSSFAALNTVDLAVFAGAAARLVRPGGRLLAHMLSPGSFARWRPPPPTTEIVVGGQPLPHHTLPPGEVYRFFERDFARRASCGMGFLVTRAMETRLPAEALELLGRLETIVGAAPPLGALGRFFLLDLERRP